MIKKKILDEINDQIQAEFESAYLYLAFAAWFDANNLGGFSHWMRMQWQEEIDHGMKFYDHVLRRDGDIELKALSKPKVDIKNAQHAFEQVLKHEQYITGRIHKLYDLAKKENDYPLQTLLHWFIDEQVEEEENAMEILDKLKLIGDHGPNLFLLDQEMAQRSAPAQGGGEGGQA